MCVAYTGGSTPGCGLFAPSGLDFISYIIKVGNFSY